MARYHLLKGNPRKAAADVPAQLPPVTLVRLHPLGLAAFLTLLQLRHEMVARYPDVCLHVPGVTPNQRTTLVISDHDHPVVQISPVGSDGGH